MVHQATETVRTRPHAREAPPTISTTQELPPPPPGRWERLWHRIRTSPVTRQALIVVPVLAVLAVGIVSGRGEGSATPAPPPRDAPAVASPLEQWHTNAEPVFAEIEATRAAIADAQLAGDPATVVAQCREASARVEDWAQALGPAPHPELAAEVRASLDALNEAFADCSLTA